MLQLRPRDKRPATKNGVNDATTDPAVIQAYRTDANLAIATGAAVRVLDVDELDHPDAQRLIAELDAAAVPYATTGRGRHYYLAGADEPTITLPWGELRGRGSYVVAPPSTHPSGERYRWVVEPNGPLPPAPAWITEGRQGLGAGTAPTVDRIPAGGGMHEHLTDRAVRLVRSGILDSEAIFQALMAEFEARAVPGGRYEGGEQDTRRIAEWACRSNIAEREWSMEAEDAYIARMSAPTKDEDTATPDPEPKTVGRRASDILENVPEEPNWLVPGVIAPGWMVKVAGREKTGKGTFIMHLLGCLERRQATVFGPAHKDAVTALVYTEEPEDSIREKIAESDLRDAFVVYGWELAGIADWPKKCAWLVKIAEQIEAGIIFVDNISRAAGVVDEGGVELGRAGEVLGEYAKAKKIAVILDHHHRKGSGKLEDKSRGGTALAGGCDNNIEMERKGDWTSRERTISSRGRIGSTIWSKTIERSPDGSQYTETTQSEHDYHLRIVAEFPEGVTVADYKDRLGCAINTARERLNALKDADLVEVVKDVTPTTYRVVERDRAQEPAL